MNVSSTGTRRPIRGTLAWAIPSNAVAIPPSVVGILNPLFAVVAMPSSSLLVAANSSRPSGGADAAGGSADVEPPSPPGAGAYQ